uniref:Uncharacterized protein n=1 Tax=Oryza punctata TaxID=4537 RepID=A0A0E0JSE3_ORYPU
MVKESREALIKLGVPDHPQPVAQGVHAGGVGRRAQQALLPRPYAALFDPALPRYDARQARIEQFHFGAEIHNVVGCERAARVERHERADQWRRRMSRAGFQSVPIKMAAKVQEWLD